MPRTILHNLVPYENTGRNFKRYQSLLVTRLKNRNIKIGQDNAEDTTNHQEKSCTNRIQIDTIKPTQNPRHKGQENNSPKKGNLISISSDHSSNVKMSSFDILKNLDMCGTIVLSNHMIIKLLDMSTPKR